jgi:hypothetical protein
LVLMNALVLGVWPTPGVWQTLLIAYRITEQSPVIRQESRSRNPPEQRRPQIS